MRFRPLFFTCLCSACRFGGYGVRRALSEARLVRHNVSDALDVSVACHLGAPIVTTNTNLANAPTIGVVFVVQDVVRQSELRVLNEAAYPVTSHGRSGQSSRDRGRPRRARGDQVSCMYSGGRCVWLTIILTIKLGDTAWTGWTAWTWWTSAPGSTAFGRTWWTFVVGLINPSVEGSIPSGPTKEVLISCGASSSRGVNAGVVTIALTINA